MSKHHRIFYQICLYSTIAALLAINIPLAIAGSRSSMVWCAIQGAVLISVFARRAWSAKVVMAWASLPVISAIALGLGLLLRGTIVQPLPLVAYKLVMMILGVYFIAYAEAALGEKVSSSHGA